IVWGYFWGPYHGTFVLLIVQYVDQFVYYNIFYNLLTPVLVGEIVDEVGDPLFQQGNAKVHTGHDTITWLSENRINLEDHLPLSPDLNLIEHAWVELKQ
ncbi:hypothetical protein C7212DRAFT_204821, partial [Tuber magnatum]